MCGSILHNMQMVFFGGEVGGGGGGLFSELNCFHCKSPLSFNFFTVERIFVLEDILKLISPCLSNPDSLLPLNKSCVLLLKQHAVNIIVCASLSSCGCVQGDKPFLEG